MENNQNGIIIFCQAPADVQFILNLYEEYKAVTGISVYVINLEGLYRYFVSLNLNLKDLVFIPYPEKVPLKNLKQLYRIKKQIGLQYNRYFQNTENQTVYFFSKYFDWLTSFFIAGISKKNKVFLIDHSGQTFSGCIKTGGLITSYRKMIYKYLTSVCFRFLKMQSTTMMEFPAEKYNIQCISYQSDPSVVSKYRIHNASNNKKSVLLFENNQAAYDFYTDYKKDMLAVLDVLRESGYKIYLKPHPRQGYSKFVEPYSETILQAEIPGEFFNPDDFTFIAGVDTNSVAHFAKDHASKTISLLELFGFRRADEKERFRQTQIKLSDGKINFAGSLPELKEMIS
jgi:hypothetical protein